MTFIALLLPFQLIPPLPHYVQSTCIRCVPKVGKQYCVKQRISAQSLAGFGMVRNGTDKIRYTLQGIDSVVCDSVSMYVVYGTLVLQDSYLALAAIAFCLVWLD